MNPRCTPEVRTCYRPGMSCRARTPRGFICSRPLGHDGDHIACGSEFHDCERILLDTTKPLKTETT
jgi:hypothetical protein